MDELFCKTVMRVHGKEWNVSVLSEVRLLGFSTLYFSVEDRTLHVDDKVSSNKTEQKAQST